MRTGSAQSAVSRAAPADAAPPPPPLVPVMLLSRLSRGRGRSGDGCRGGVGLLTERGEGLLTDACEPGGDGDDPCRGSNQATGWVSYT